MPTPLSVDFLRSTYTSYGCPRERWLVGGEFERAVVRGDGKAVGYADPDGIAWILNALADRTGWERYREGENVIALQGDNASITLEPGGQVELSGAPHRTLAGLSAEVRRNRADLLALSAGHDLHWIACGLTPYPTMDEVGWVPKGRYKVMREYLPTQGDLAHWMMKGTCSVQANFDYADEADCARKFRASVELGPLNTAIFANSPLAAGRDTGFLSYRGHIWTRTDPARTGFPAAVRDGYTHARWVDYLLDTPMMFYKPGGQWRPANGVTFRTWMNDGIDGVFPTEDDWALHQTSVFPEVRVKRTIEIRGADQVSMDLAVGFCALWTGVLYGALDEALALSAAFAAPAETPEARHHTAALHGLEGSMSGRLASEWARELVDIARKGLVAIGEDTSHLEALAAQVASGVSPGRRMLDAWRRDPSPANVLPTIAY